ncbi:hypothetical protein [Actinomadura vinacea]|uniref:hypothetical protein n=1 Tax=Actinomadura vinacea TaxID=115336 RepID=UPI0031DCA3D1
MPDDWPLGVRVAAAVAAAIAAGAAGSFVTEVMNARRAKTSTRGVLEHLLRPLTPPAPVDEAEQSVFTLLLATTCPTPFWGRQAERQRLWDWCEAPATSPVMVLGGHGGCGKTRLALQAARGLDEDWVTGWLKADTGPQLVDAVAAAEMPTLVLVDDADTRTDVGTLLDAVAAHDGRPPLRVLLITRHGDGLRQALIDAVEEPHRPVIVQAPVLTLRRLGQQGDLIRWYGEATVAFATRSGRSVPHLSSATAPVQEGQTLLEVLAAAMFAVLHAAGPGDQVLGESGGRRPGPPPKPRPRPRPPRHRAERPGAAHRKPRRPPEGRRSVPGPDG